MAQGNLPGGHPGVSEPAASASPQLTWKTPEGWTEMPLGSMRAASFKITKDGKVADVSVIPLAGAAGGDAANVNRWREQAGLKALSPDDLKATAQKIDIAGEPADLYEIAGTNPSSGDPMRILGAIQHRSGTAWFYKITGENELVAAQKSAFLDFLKSVRFAAAQSSELPPSHPPIDGMSGSALPASHPPIDGASASSAPSSSEGKPKWSVPPGWREVSGGEFLVAKFLIGGDGATAPAAVNVSMSAGDGGGFLPNVNRWRGQLGLNALNEMELAHLQPEREGFKLVDFTGTDARSGKPSRLIGVMVAQPGRAWFYKLMGDAPVVEREKDAFVKFVQSAKY
jgi:hypothetical protein